MIARALVLLALLAALAGCGNKLETRTLGNTEGLYLDVGDLKYQVQMSRLINPADIEDSAYLEGLTGSVLIATDRSRDGERVDGRLQLGPWEGVVLALE